MNFVIPDTGTVVTLGGYAQLDVIHDFDKIGSPTAFVTRDIVVDGKPSGQDDVAALPETLDHEGPNASQQTFQGLVRWTRDFQDRYTLWIAVEDPDYDIGNGNSRSSWPDTIVSLNWHGDRSHLKPAFIGRSLRGKNNQGKSDSVFGWGLQLAGILNVPLLDKKDNISF